jgi:thymidine kinase
MEVGYVVGKIHVITGPMKSRKTLDIILMAKEAVIQGKKFVAFHPAISSRCGENQIVSRLTADNAQDEDLKLSIPSTPIPKDMPLFLEEYLPKDADIVIFDDAQFFSNRIIAVCSKLRMIGIDVYIAGLDMDSFLQPFGPLPYLMTIADEVTKLTSICHDCQGRAQTTYRLAADQRQELVGDKEYIPLCYECYADRREEETLDFKINKEEKDNE